MDGTEIPIVKLTIDHMRHSILQALDPDLLSQQLEKSCRKALMEINFEKTIKFYVQALLDDVLQSDEICEPIREYLGEQLQKATEKILAEEKG